MHIVTGSISIVLRGDWNSYYLQPQWISEKICESEEMEVGFKVEGYKTSISYRKNNVTIDPRPDAMIFTAQTTDEEVLKTLTAFVTNFLATTETPAPIIYGLNVKYHESDTTSFAIVVDSISDSDKISDCGYIIEETHISRKITKDDKVLNVTFDMNTTGLTVSFNEHHTDYDENSKISYEDVKSFLDRTSFLLSKLGYSIEGMEDD